MTSALERALIEGIDAVERQGLRYAIVGDLAVGAWGVSRSTRDVDLYVEMPSGHRPDLARSLVDIQGFRSFVRSL
jgi:hypothetical protein